MPLRARLAVIPRILFLLLLLGASAPGAPQGRADLPRPTLEKIERLIAEEMARQEIPGLSVAVVVEGELRGSRGYGFADLENFVPAKASTVYRLASISKPITAVAALQLAEGGKLDLDADIRKYVPSFPEKPWPVTARQLLGHLGGIRHYRGSEEVASTRRYAGVTEALAIFRDDPLLQEPGTKYTYTTYGYNLLGGAVESAAGMKFMDYLRERIFRPAGMDRIRDDDQQALIPNRAQGYRKTPEGDLRNSILADVSNKIPGGGLCSTVEDLARFAIAVQKGTLLSAESTERMFTRQKTKDGQETRYGLGWSIDERDGRKEVTHGGGQPRVATFLYMLPQERCAVALMTNLEGARLPDLARRIADAALGR
jgi:CubicO group peptidase (beta-lactamase class C family)